jgi:suppressor for copper-sensitivity B
MPFRFLFLLISFLFLAPSARAEAPHNSEARLIAAVKGADNLKTLEAGVDIKLNPGWKAYWRTPGEAGLAPVFNWDGSENFKSAKISWPAPTRFVAFDIDNFGYENEVVFPVEITPQEEGKPVSLQLKLDLLVCKDLCVPESHTLSLRIPAGEAQVSGDQPLLADALKKIPATENTNDFMIENVWLDEGDDKKVYLHAYGISAAAPGKDADLFVESRDFVSIGKPSFTYNASTTELQVQAPVRSSDAMDNLNKKLGKGALTLTYVDNGRIFERHKTLGGAQKTPAVTTIIRETQEHANLSILLLAFIGGLILNLMPCVLPVLSIKILSVLSHGGKDHRLHRWEIFRSFIAAAAGIIFSFWVMAAALISLKNAGETIGWGIQFQNPAFIIFLVAVLFIFAANMWGLFEIPLPRFIARHLAAKHEHAPTLLGHFLTGAFATLLATPCTAPILGTAISFALARQATDIFIIFTVIGLGLAAPYLLLAMTPRIFKYWRWPCCQSQPGCSAF